MVTEVEFPFVLSDRATFRLTNHPKFWTRVGQVFKFRPDLTEQEANNLENLLRQNLVMVRRTEPDPVIPPDDPEHILKDSWRERGLWGPKGFVDEKARQTGLKELAQLNKKLMKKEMK